MNSNIEKEQQAKKRFELSDDWRKRRLRLEDNFPRPEPLICRNGVPVAARGAITLLSGAKKTYKTRLHQALQGALLMGNDPAPVFTATKPGLKALVLDTEQHPGELHEEYHALVISQGRPATRTPEEIMAYSLLGFSPEEMQATLEQALAELHPDIVILDGVADFVLEINDQTACDQLVKRLQVLAFQHDCAIITVIHLNPGSQKERGHLGTILGNKASFYVCLTRSLGDVLVSCKDGCRWAPFPEFYVGYDSAKDIVVEIGQSKAPAPEMKRPTISKNVELAKAIPNLFQLNPFGDCEPLKESEIVNALMSNAKLTHRTTAYRAFDTALKNGLIKEFSPGSETYVINNQTTNDNE